MGAQQHERVRQQRAGSSGLASAAPASVPPVAQTTSDASTPARQSVDELDAVEHSDSEDAPRRHGRILKAVLKAIRPFSSTPESSADEAKSEGSSETEEPSARRPARKRDRIISALRQRVGGS